jgi:hypothetical protein
VAGGTNPTILRNSQRTFAAAAAAHDDKNVSTVNGKRQIALHHKAAVSHGQVVYCDVGLLLGHAFSIIIVSIVRFQVSPGSRVQRSKVQRLNNGKNPSDMIQRSEESNQSVTNSTGSQGRIQNL